MINITLKQLRYFEALASHGHFGRAATASAWIGDLLAALPESWTRGLYLPDFEPEPDPHEKLSEDPFERLGTNRTMPMH